MVATVLSTSPNLGTQMRMYFSLINLLEWASLMQSLVKKLCVLAVPNQSYHMLIDFKGNLGRCSRGYCSFRGHFLREFYQVQRTAIPHGRRIVWCELSQFTF